MALFYRDVERFLPRFGPDVLPQRVSNYAGVWGRIDGGFRRQRGAEIHLNRR
ncbi:MAG: hypothetical protein FJY97_00360 [candidate division Zixibacteria bacterium]|nr:hypothetical protein [candidate division Zixibacteria bacterium]